MKSGATKRFDFGGFHFICFKEWINLFFDEQNYRDEETNKADKGEGIIG